MNALLDLTSIKDVRISVEKIFWAGFDFYDSLEDRVFGKLSRWTNKNTFSAKVDWDDGESEVLNLPMMLSCGLQLEPYEDNRPAPHPKRRRNTGGPPGGSSSLATSGVRAQDAADTTFTGESVHLQYKRGGRRFDIEWKGRTTEAITMDARTEERWRPKINRDQGEYRTPFLMWQNVALPWPFIEKMFGPDGFMNQRLSGKDQSAFHRRTTVGEGIALLGYMFAIAINPGVPVRQMWQERPKEGEKRILPLPAIGKYGISENRFEKLTSLLGMMHSVAEGELDENDPWRYCNFPIDCHNKHWREVYFNSWLLAPDESMSPFLPGAEGDGHDDIPFLSNVPRKPKPIGAEIKDVADGESGAVVFLELALKYIKV